MKNRRTLYGGATPTVLRYFDPELRAKMIRDQEPENGLRAREWPPRPDKRHPCPENGLRAPINGIRAPRMASAPR